MECEIMSWEAWGDPDDEIPNCPHCEENHGVTEELAMLVKRLVRLLRKASPDNDLAKLAMDYLRDNGLEGESLRDGEL